MLTPVTTSSKRWDLSIEMLKAIAAILVMNSHMDAMYGEYSYLGTGGAIGDALFFFCSGYALFLSKREENFFNWYKRRVQRIYPSVLIISLIGATYVVDQYHYSILTDMGTSWFIMCIFLFYALLYPIKRYASNHLRYVMLAVVAIIIAWYFVWGIEPKSAGNIYGVTYFKWSVYFLLMLFGAVCGKMRIEPELSDKYHIKRTPNVFVALTGVVVSVCAFYAIFIYTQTSEREPYQLFSIIPLMSTCWFLWRFANTDFSAKLMSTKSLGWPIRFTGGLCLEILIGQAFIFTTKLNYLFPWNIPYLMIKVILFAYIVRTLSRILLQTFQKEEYEWRAILEPF
jgi:Predicted acyltransferases